MPQLALVEEPETTEFVGREPGWIVKSGISLIFIVFCLFLVLSWYIQYPDTIQSRIRLSANSPSVDLVAKVSGKVDHLLVADGAYVKADTPLILLESDLEYDELNRLKNLLISTDLNPNNIIAKGQLLLTEVRDSHLGSLQVPFNQFLTAIESYRIQKESLQLTKKRQHTEQQILKYHSLIDELEIRLENRKNKLNIESKILGKNEEALKKGLTTEADFLAMRSRYLDMELELTDIEKQKGQYNLEIANFEQSLEEFEITTQEESENLWNTVRQYNLALNNAINEWNKRYIITAPISGYVSFSTRLTQFQYIKENENIISLAPDLRINRGQMTVKHQGSGKISIGQKVFIELDSLPPEEFGRLYGVVLQKALVPTENGILVNIELSQPAKTDYGYELPVVAELYGNAKIITEDKRLLTRFFDKLIYMINLSTGHKIINF